MSLCVHTRFRIKKHHMKREIKHELYIHRAPFFIIWSLEPFVLKLTKAVLH